MIFWDKVKIQNASNLVEISVNSDNAASMTKAAIGAASITNATITNATITNANINSSLASSLTVASGHATNMTITNAAITNLTITNPVTIPTNSNGSFTSLSVANNLTATGTVVLPSNTTVGGYTWRPGPTQYNLLWIDGKINYGDDWIKVVNKSAQLIQIRIDLYNDAAYQSPYQAQGQAVSGYSTALIQPGYNYQLNFRDNDGDPFLQNNGYIRVRYRFDLTSSSSEDGWNDINGDKIRAHDVEGDSQDVTRTYGGADTPAAWFRNVLYENDAGTEYWVVFSLGANTSSDRAILGTIFGNMLTTMKNAGYTHVSILGNLDINQRWQPINDVIQYASTYYYIGGIIGFLKAS